MNHYGFNFQWMAAWQPDQKPDPADEKVLDFLAEYGFNFIRVPLDYRFWTHDFDYFHPDESVFSVIDGYLEACQSRGIHLSLSLHRAPGYCTNGNDLERHNLWGDEIAQSAFVFLWETFATRYKGIPDEWLSFNLVNEPPRPGAHGMTRQNHAALIQRTVTAIRAIDPKREIVIDGLGGGYLPVPELANLGVIHSGRGYHPMPVTHHRAGWWADHVKAPAPKYPGLQWQGRVWDRLALRDSYKPWRELEKREVKIHIGEFGCFKHTPDDIARRWYTDLLSIYKDFGWGYALWQFQGPFGIVQHGRPGASFELLKGYSVDRFLLDLLLESRVP
ncbi:MAG TPA: cellulase family glycosylhydrolase [Anaerolineales bacterium]|nr:cellulase family glycosylhydrolase [Anaerolineales bacterium]